MREEKNLKIMKSKELLNFWRLRKRLKL